MVNQDLPRPLLIVELAGLAGTGKTTLARTLIQKGNGFILGAPVSLRRAKYLPHFVSDALSLRPLFLKSVRGDRCFTWDEIKAMIYLKTWPLVLKDQTPVRGAVIIMDHGPVYRLAKLLASGPSTLKGAEAQQWWNEMYRRWASLLSVVVRLDAPNEVLEKRINDRPRAHLLKGKPTPAVNRSLNHFRACFEQVLAGLSAHGGPQILSVDTANKTVQQVADSILATLARGNER